MKNFVTASLIFIAVIGISSCTKNTCSDQNVDSKSVFF